MNKKGLFISPTNAKGELHGECVRYHNNGEVVEKAIMVNGVNVGYYEYNATSFRFKKYYIV